MIDREMMQVTIQTQKNVLARINRLIMFKHYWAMIS